MNVMHDRPDSVMNFSPFRHAARSKSAIASVRGANQMAPTMANETVEANARPESPALDPAVHSLLAPTNEEIAKLAYSLWEKRGGAAGSADEDWLMAEAELRRR